MTIIKKIAILIVSILVFSACKNGSVEQSQSYDNPVIEFPQSVSYDTTTVVQTIDTITISRQPKTNVATVHSHDRYYNGKKEINRNGYAERKKTNELLTSALFSAIHIADIENQQVFL